MKVGAVGRRLALSAVYKVGRGDVLPYSLGSPRYFPNSNDYTYEDFLIYCDSASMMVTNNKVTYCRNFEYETDLADERPPYSRVITLHGRKVKTWPVVS